MSQKQVMPKSEDLSRSLEINAIWTFDTEFPIISINHAHILLSSLQLNTPQTTGLRLPLGTDCLRSLMPVFVRLSNGGAFYDILLQNLPFNTNFLVKWEEELHIVENNEI